VIHGATTIWERWNGWTAEDGFFDPQMNSFNHYSLGSVGEWLFRHVAGIELDPATVGFKQFIIKPYLGSHLTRAGACYESIHGRIESRWRVSGDQLQLSVTVPANTRARVFVPCRPDGTVLENGRPAELSQSIQEVGRAGDFAVFLVEAGVYQFTATISASEYLPQDR
jgi:alpha-L-rhamnosidase